MNCSACRCPICQEDYLRCMIDSCRRVYHIICTGAKNLTSDEKKAWICPECQCTTKKGGDNSLTPVGRSKLNRDPNVTFRKKTSEVAKVSDEEPGALAVEIRSLRSEMSILRDQLINAVSLISSYESKLDKYAAQVVALNAKLEEYQTKSSKIFPSPYNHSTREPTPQNQRQKAPMSGPNNKTLLDRTTSDKVPVIVNLAAKYPGSSTGKNDTETEVSCNDTTHDDQQWTEVKKRKSRGPLSLCGAAGPAITALKAVEPIKYIHLWNMVSNNDEVLQYLKQLCPAGSCSVEELNPRGNYKSYKIGVPEIYYDKCFSIDVWPINARIKAWINFRKPAQTRVRATAAENGAATRQSFRGSRGAP